MSFAPTGLSSYQIDDLSPVAVGPGCWRRDLPPSPGARVWSVDIEPGASWPHVDVHDHLGEFILVVAGELIEGEQRFGPGTYVQFGPDSCHRPRSEQGARLFGFNLL